MGCYTFMTHGIFYENTSLNPLGYEHIQMTDIMIKHQTCKPTPCTNKFSLRIFKDMKKLIIFLVALEFTTLSFADDTLPRKEETLTHIYDQVLSLHLGCNGYTLGAPLTPAQEETAVSHMMEETTPGTYKFMDGNLNVVADAATHRVMLLFEKFNDVSGQAVHDLVGSLFMNYDEPTTSAHDKIVYWAYDIKGKISSQQFQKAKSQKKHLDILATVKLNSSIEILGKKPATEKGNVYYIISSSPVLKHFQ